MIDAPTVLILGAGASAPYGFPLGRALLLQICDRIRKEHGDGHGVLVNTLRADGFVADEIAMFQKELRRSMQPSVDAFLENREEEEYVEIGKYAIAASLAACEKESVLLPLYDPEGEMGGMRWYEYLFRQMGSRRDDFSENKLSIITFNYDRSIEYFFYLALKNSYGLEESEVTELIQSIRIVHLHGQLGKPHFLGEDGRHYSHHVDGDVIRRCASEIKIIHEESGDTEEFKRAHGLIEEARIVCLIGFGYHEVNVRRLRIHELSRTGGKQVYGCAYGFKENERKQIRGLFPSLRHIGFLSPPNLDALNFLREMPVFK